jgi:hypothetical protein
MQDSIEKLKAAGFSDDDIKEYMDHQQSQNGLDQGETAENQPKEQDVPFAMQPTPVAPGSNMAEGNATALAGIDSAMGSHIGHAIEAYGTYKLGKPLVQRALGIMPNTAPSQPLTSTARNLNPSQLMEALKTGQLPPAEQPGMLSRVGQLAGRYAPMLGSIAKYGGVAAAGMTPGTLNANEDEELRKRRALTQMQGNPNNQQGMNALNSGFANQLNSLSR